jgi:VWFA-related protein
MALAACALGAAGRAQQAVFRAATDLVSVGVSVTKGRTPVAGLTAADFVLLDNGVRQEIEAMSIETLPIDVTFVLDLSGSTASSLKAFKTSVDRMRGMLRPTDRLRLVTFADRVREIVAMQPAANPLPLDRIASGQATSLQDGIFYALAWPAEPDRRHLVVAFTDGVDTWSTLDPDRLPVLASHADAVLHVVLSPSAFRIVPSRFQMVQGVLVETPPEAPPTSVSTVPDGSASVQALNDTVRRTGGAVHRLADNVAAFQEVLDDFRSSYLLRYTPHGVERAGWHDITVTLARSGSFTIRARKGYQGG